jgi:hypothetical protein
MKTESNKLFAEASSITVKTAVSENPTNKSRTIWEKLRGKRSHHLLLVGLAGFLLLLSASGWSQCCIGPQYPDFHLEPGSQNTGPGYNPYVIAYENFTPLGTTPVTHVTWWGSYFDPSEQGAISGFTVDLYSSSGGLPGTLLSSFETEGNAGETFVRLNDLGDPTYQYGLDLNFTATAGTEYWMSIVPDLALPAHWGWESSSQGDGQAYQCLNGVCGSLPTDLAFVFEPQSTPEPSSLLLFGSGILGLAGLLRRKLMG